MTYKEDGSTRRSVENAKRILVDRGVPDEIRLWHDQVRWYQVQARWQKPPFTHLFEGFSWGYSGEGPHGLLTLFKAIGLPVSMGEISHWPERFGTPRGKIFAGPKEWSPAGAVVKNFLKDVDYGKDWI